MPRFLPRQSKNFKLLSNLKSYKTSNILKSYFYITMRFNIKTLILISNQKQTKNNIRSILNFCKNSVIISKIKAEKYSCPTKNLKYLYNSLNSYLFLTVICKRANSWLISIESLERRKFGNPSPSIGSTIIGILSG